MTVVEEVDTTLSSRTDHLSSSSSSSSSGGTKTTVPVVVTPPHDTLISSKALELSLTPPRVPPFGSTQRAVLMGKVVPNGLRTTNLQWSRHYRVRESPVKEFFKDDCEAQSPMPHETLQQRVYDQILNTRQQQSPSTIKHPHLSEKSADTITRQIGLWWSVPKQNYFRDSGMFRAVADGFIVATIPFMVLSHPAAMQQFRTMLPSRCIRYGPHPRQVLDLYEPKVTTTTNVQYNHCYPQRLIFFVHGGAWGSGQTYMYRLVAAPYLAQGWTVAVIGYRTYPDGCVQEQTMDLELAASALQRECPFLCTHGRTTLMGHSSGAHIALLMLVERIQEQALLNLQQKQQQQNNKSHQDTKEPDFKLAQLSLRLQFDSYVGLSGPYDIDHHFDYEAARGVEELSPMKPVNGLTRTNFRHNSPARRLCTILATAATAHNEEDVLPILPPSIALVHGMEDDTVPFTATAQAACVLRSCGVPGVQEIYIPATGHQDVVMQLMLGGKAREITIEWIKDLKCKSQPIRSKILAKSKL